MESHRISNAVNRRIRVNRSIGSVRELCWDTEVFQRDVVKKEGKHPTSFRLNGFRVGVFFHFLPCLDFEVVILIVAVQLFQPIKQLVVATPKQ